MQTADAQHEVQDYAQRKITMKGVCISNSEGKSPSNP